MSSGRPLPDTAHERFERDMRTSRRYLTVIAYRVARNADDAEDLLSETYTRAWQHYHQQDPDRATFTRWASRILLNLHRDTHRNARRQPVTERLHDLDWPASNTLEPYEVVSKRLLVRGILDKLTPRQQDILIRLAHGQSYEEIGKAMGIVVGTVKSRVFHLRNVIAPRLASLQGTNDL